MVVVVGGVGGVLWVVFYVVVYVAWVVQPTTNFLEVKLGCDKKSNSMTVTLYSKDDWFYNHTIPNDD